MDSSHGFFPKMDDLSKNVIPFYIRVFFPFIVPRLLFWKALNHMGLEQSLGRCSHCDVRSPSSLCT